MDTADKVGVTAGFLSRLERDLVGVSEPVLQKLSQVLEVPEKAIAVEEKATPDPVLNGPAVRAIRLAKGIRAGEFAAAIGMDKAALSRLEYGQQAISVTEARVIADALRVPLMTVFVVPPVWR